jgi:prefoldin subunit 5
MTQEQFVPDIEQVKKVSLQFQEVFQRMDREIGVLDALIAELDKQIQTTRRSPFESRPLND